MGRRSVVPPLQDHLGNVPAISKTLRDLDGKHCEAIGILQPLSTTSLTDRSLTNTTFCTLNYSCKNKTSFAINHIIKKCYTINRLQIKA